MYRRSDASLFAINQYSDKKKTSTQFVAQKFSDYVLRKIEMNESLNEWSNIDNLYCSMWRISGRAS